MKVVNFESESVVYEIEEEDHCIDFDLDGGMFSVYPHQDHLLISCPNFNLTVKTDDTIMIEPV